LNDLGFVAFRELEYKVLAPVGGRYTYYPGTTEIPEAARRGPWAFRLRSLLKLNLQAIPKALFRQGSRFGGYSMFVKDGTLTFVYNFLGIPPEQRLSCKSPSLGKHVVGVEFVKERIGENHETLGKMTLYVR
jgi:arylsulfatase